MSIIYYYTKKENLPIFLKYGIRLSKNFDKELNINGYVKPYLIGLLNPKDDMQKYNSNDFTCLKLDILDDHLKVVDKNIINNSSGTQIEYSQINTYILGTIKNPIVLADTSVISNKICVYNKNIDIPLLYNNSEDFFYELNVRKLIDDLPIKDVYELLKNYSEKF